MSVIVNPLHHYYREAHLQHVIGEMRKKGAPTIKAYFDGEIWHAREGTHRLRAAKALGVEPIMMPVPWNKTRSALERARYAAIRNGHTFASVKVRQ